MLAKSISLNRPKIDNIQPKKIEKAAIPKKDNKAIFTGFICESCFFLKGQILSPFLIRKSE